jgi:hypothetical protein
MYILHARECARVEFTSYCEKDFYELLDQSEKKYYTSGLYDVIIDNNNQMIGIRVEILSIKIRNLLLLKEYSNVSVNKVKVQNFPRAKLVELACIYSYEITDVSNCSILELSENCQFYLYENQTWDLFLLDLAPAGLFFKA